MSKETNEPKIKGPYTSTRKPLPERVAGTPHTDVDAEKSPRPKSAGKVQDGSQSLRTPKKFPVRKGNESAQK